MSAIYETNKSLAEYLLFHFGSDAEILPSDKKWPAGMHEALDFPLRTVRHFPKTRVARGLDLGCAVGRSAFEMARNCDEVIGVDFSHAFIHAAQALARGEAIAYERREEAALTTQLTAKLRTGLVGEKVHFMQGDAMNLPATLGSFDWVHAANLLCRLPEPARLMARFPALVNPGGHLVIATPCTWLEEFTPPENWPQAGTLAWLKAELSRNFELLDQGEEPFLIRETARKFQWTHSLVTVWKRNDLNPC